jgi:prepilin-type N-terminal cleavage/methylation domain-containing protein
MKPRRGGFSLIEVLIALILVGILVRFAIPNYTEVKRRAKAAKLIGDMRAIRTAAFAYYTEKGTWPAEAGPGVVPPELVPHLPENFSFTKPEYTLDWESWSGGGGDDQAAEALIGTTAITVDEKLAEAAYRLSSSGYVPIISGNRITLLVSGASGADHSGGGATADPKSGQ